MKKILTAVLLTLILFGCKNQNEKPAKTETPEKITTGKIEIADPWIRPAIAEMNTAIFFTIKNGTAEDDTLYDAGSKLAEKTEVHETFKNGEQMGMRHRNFVVIPAGTSVKFKPRGLHVMLVKLYNDLTMGEYHKAELFFKKAGKIEFEGVVRDMPKN